MNQTNHNYFQEIDTELKAYMLGFIYADGYIMSRRINEKALGFFICEKDKYLLDKFQTEIAPHIKVGIVQNGKNKAAQLRVASKKIYSDLCKWGVYEHKSTLNSHNLKVPSIDPSLIRHFIRGFFDGDGGISRGPLDKNTRTLEFYNSSEELIKSIFSCLESAGLEGGSISYRLPVIKAGFNSTMTIWRSVYCNNKQMDFFKDYFYKDSTIYLERKKYYFDSIAVPIAKSFICPYCKSTNCTRNGRRALAYRFKCKDCSKGFSVKAIC